MARWDEEGITELLTERLQEKKRDALPVELLRDKKMQFILVGCELSRILIKELKEDGLSDQVIAAALRALGETCNGAMIAEGNG